ncbi:hypothetical protein B0I35DRAFT_192968 [Stachybotrys elegans]|uniref:Fungal N-terminal domain-containing protein n=1 Tax=Stachybotrys elegans TaxID=80388 RepID=A0A8K0SWS6_9HYPO|nr:hypothetical protein B0I35DRAFT_192968 [Stachybotrys elegans]
MAELVGLVSGAAGLTSLAITMASGADKLRKAYNKSGVLPDEVKALAEDVDFLRSSLDGLTRVQTSTSSESPELIYCRNRLQAVASALNGIPNIVSQEPVAGKTKEQLTRLKRMRHYKALDDIKVLVVDAKQSITLAILCHRLKTMPLPLLDSPTTPEADGAQPNPIVANTTGQILQDDSHIHYMVLPRRRSMPSLCTRRGCTCRCHTTGMVTNRFWSFEYTPLSIMLGNCDDRKCNGRRYRISFRVAMSQLGLPWAVTAGFTMQSEARGLSLYPSLNAQRVVKYTSPGFKLLHELKWHIIEIDEFVVRFRELWRNNPGMKYHVNPAGQGYIEYLLKCDGATPSWCKLGDELKFAQLLDVLVREFDMTEALENAKCSIMYCSISFGTKNSRETKRAVLDKMIELGYCPGDPNPRDWPLGETTLLTASPLTVLDPYFGGTSAFQYDIINRPDKALKTLRRSSDFDQSTNFLGQTPLHIAVAEQESLVLPLLKAGHPVDARSFHGLTPLDYAAMTGNIEVAQHLIRHGASLTDNGRKLFQLALDHNQAHFPLEVIDHVKNKSPLGSKFPSELAESCCDLIAVLNIFGHSNEQSALALEAILPLLRDIDIKLGPDDQFVNENLCHIGNSRRFAIAGGNTNHLLHYNWPVRLANMIMERGYSNLNARNRTGATALMYAASNGQIELVTYYISQGADISLQDEMGWNALDYALRAWAERGSSGTSAFPALQQVVDVLLSAGLNPGHPTQGLNFCSSLRTSFFCFLSCHLDHSMRWYSFFDVATEWLSLLKSMDKKNLAKLTLLSLLKRGRTYLRRDDDTYCFCQRSESEICGIWTTEDGKEIDFATLSVDELTEQWMHQLLEYHLSFLQTKGVVKTWSSILDEWDGTTIRYPRMRMWPGFTVTMDIERDRFHVTHLAHLVIPLIALVRIAVLLQLDWSRWKSKDWSDRNASLLSLVGVPISGSFGGQLDPQDGSKSLDDKVQQVYDRRLRWILAIQDAMNIPLGYLVKGMRNGLYHTLEWMHGLEGQSIFEKVDEVMEQFHESRSRLLLGR